MRSYRARFAQSLGALRVAFGNPDLRRLQLAGAGSITGQWAYTVALAVFAYDRGGATAVGLVGVIQTLPAATLAPFAAVLGDRYPRERVMVASDIGRTATIAAAGAAALAGGPAAIVYGLAAVAAVVATAFPPAQRAIMPSLARTPAELTAANVAGSTIFSVGSFAGPALGGLLLALTSPGVVLLTAAVTFLWSGALISRIRTAGVVAVAWQSVGSIAAESLAGFRAIAHEPRVRLILGLGSAQTFVRGALGVLIVVVALDLLEQNESGVGFMNAAVGVGGLAGVLVALSLVGRQRLASDLGVGIALWGLPLALIGVWPQSVAALVLLGVVGLANTLVDVSALTLLQRSVDDRLLARVFGVLESLVTASVGLGAVLAPLLITAFGPRMALVLTGALLPLLAALAWPSLRRIDEGAAVPLGLELLRGLPIFAPLYGPTLEQLASRLQPVTVPLGAAVIREGEPGDRFYVVERGRVAVSQSGEPIGELGPGDSFGEIALLRDVPRTATVSAIADTDLYALERRDFLAAVTGDVRAAAAADAVVEARLARA